jgi:thiol-disulfide isomerase/thioredoxin
MNALLLTLFALTPPPQAPTAAAPVKIVCPECNGEGVVNNGSDSSFVSHWDTCPTCHGRKYLEGIPLLSEAAEPHLPGPPCPNCQCGCTETGRCNCKDCDHPLLVKPVKPILGPSTKNAPKYQFLILSHRPCVPCEKMAAELKADGDDLPWDIFINSVNLDAKYNVTAYPTILLLKDGREKARHEGYMSVPDLTRWLADPDQPQSRGESVPKQTYTIVQPVYRPMVRYMAACSGSS